MAHEDILDSVTNKVADLAVQYMGVDRARLLAGTPLVDVMDSLWVMELVMLLEREYGVELDIASSICRGPSMNVTSLAREVLRARKAGAPIADAIAAEVIAADATAPAGATA